MTSRILATAVTTLVLALGAALPASAEMPERQSLQIIRDISREVHQYSNYTVFDDVNASVENGVVRLTGKVTMPYKRDDIARRVARVTGVTTVVNDLEVLPVSQYDEELRQQISRAIYGNPSFWHYASMPNPPIHIVVDRGRVTLTGVVQSNVERMLARSIATSFGAFSVKDDLRTDAEVQAALEKTI